MRAEAVDGQAQVMQLGVIDEDEAVVEVVGVGDREVHSETIQVRMYYAVAILFTRPLAQSTAASADASTSRFCFLLW